MTAEHLARLKRMSNKEKAKYLDYVAYLQTVAKNTGRVIFGQLWDPGIPEGIEGVDFVFSALFTEPIAEMLNQPNTLLKYLEAEQQWSI